MLIYIKNLWLLIRNFQKNPKALTGYLVFLVLMGLKAGLLQWFGISLSPEIEDFLRDNVLMDIMAYASVAIASFYTRLINMLKEKWERIKGDTFKRLPEEV